MSAPGSGVWGAAAGAPHPLAATAGAGAGGGWRVGVDGSPESFKPLREGGFQIVEHAVCLPVQGACAKELHIR